jgi:hypothetical protein
MGQRDGGGMDRGGEVMSESETVDPALRPGRPLPLIAVLLGLAMLASAALILPRVAPPLPLTTLVGAGAAAGLLFWLLALAAGLRRGPGWWTAASLALLIGGGALAGLNASRIGHAGTAADASTFAELELNPDATPILPSNPGRGAISTAYAALVRADERAVKVQNAEIAKFNLGTLNSPYLLSQAPAILSNCPSIGALASAAEKAGADRATRVAALARATQTANLADDVKQAIVLIVTPPEGAAEALLKQEREMWQATQSLCQLLAKRGWSNANGYFGFGSATDKAAFDALNQRRLAVEGERKRIRDGIRKRFEDGREKVRAALS